MHTGVPVSQVMAPVRHGFPGTVQAVPAAHATQLPVLQTMYWPQTVPFAWGCWVSMQLGPPGPHVVVPT